MPGRPTVKVEQRGAEKAALDIRELGIRASDVRVLSYKVGRVVAASNKQRFDTRGRGRWKPLDADTVRIKSQQGVDPRLLRRTGKMYEELTSPRALKADAHYLLYGTEQFYARFANSGTKTGEPRRKLITLKNDERKEIKTIFARYVVEARR